MYPKIKRWSKVGYVGVGGETYIAGIDKSDIVLVYIFFVIKNKVPNKYNIKCVDRLSKLECHDKVYDTIDDAKAAVENEIASKNRKFKIAKILKSLND